MTTTIFQCDIFPQFLLFFRTEGVPERYIIGLVNTLNPHAMEYKEAGFFTTKLLIFKQEMVP
jgi:hypothetical protein